jgi:hypothetical protein
MAQNKLCLSLLLAEKLKFEKRFSAYSEISTFIGSRVGKELVQWNEEKKSRHRQRYEERGASRSEPTTSAQQQLM